MGQTRLINICQDILACWREKKEVDEEQGYIFFDGILDEIFGAEEEVGADYKKVSARLNEMWQYRDFDGLSAADAFLCGSLWGGIKIAEMNRKRFRQQKTMEELVRVYAKKLWFFEAISLNPGIRHKDLAQKGNQSTSQLSQFVTGVVKEGLVSYNRIGREKYYYLKKRGELVYKELKKNHSYGCESREVLLKKLESMNDEIPESIAKSLFEKVNGQDGQSFQGYYTGLGCGLKNNRNFNLMNYENENIEIFKSEREEPDTPCKKMELMMPITNI